MVTREKDEKKLGMGRAIPRRDFLNGFAVAVGGSLLSPGTQWFEHFGLPHSPLTAQSSNAYYPPALTGMRGTTDAVMEVGHALRDGNTWSNPTPDSDSYDLIVVGGGISGLASAYFFRKLAGTKAKILILENHDDFGGHARRNEFHTDRRMILGYGGTQSIAGPKLYSKQAKELLADLGVDVQRFYKYYDRTFEKANGLARSMFFDKKTFGEDRLVAGIGKPTWPEFFAKTPLSPQVQKDLVWLYTEKVDYLPHLSSWDKKVLLAKTSYKDYLLNYVKVSPDAIPVMQTETYGLYGVGIDAVPAGDLAGLGYPGFAGMDLSGPPGPGLGVEITKQDEGDEPYIFHFPDGNASIARLLVRSLIPASASGHTMEDIVTAKLNYGTLDDASSPVRLRLNSTAIHARNIGDPATAKEVEVTYVKDGRAHTVRGATCILACWNMVIPFMCPELSDKQKDALAYGVKVPLVYTQCADQQLGVVQKTWCERRALPGKLLRDRHARFSGQHGWVSIPERSCRTLPPASRKSPVQTRSACPRSTKGRAPGTSHHHVRNLRAAYPRTARRDAFSWRLRPGT